MNKSSTPNYELFKDAYAILDGIPPKAIDLNLTVTQRGSSLKCGTIACGVGWLGLHPKFQELGLNWNGRLTYKGEWMFYDDAIENVFGIHPDDAISIFCSSGVYSKYDNPSSGLVIISDKKRLLGRMRNYLKSKGQL